MAGAVRTVLFLCTGNFYRSRFAEILFNHKAAEAGLAWRATSRALAVERGDGVNFGAISAHTVRGLAARGIAAPAEDRYPQQVSEADLAGSDLVIAVKEAEHRPLLGSRYPGWEERVEFWHVHDLDQATPEEALVEIEEAVEELVVRLAGNGIDGVGR